MSTRVADKNLMNSGYEVGDDLTVIKGIGPARQRWLRESANVRTFQDLIALSADEIESRLKEEGQVISRNEIEGWLAQARELAPTATTSAVEGEWRSFAAFVVQFQEREADAGEEEQRITVEHIRVAQNGTWLEDDTDKKRTAIEGEWLYPWMLNQLGKRFQRVLEPDEEPSVTVAPAAPIRISPWQVKVEVTGIKISQRGQAWQPIGSTRESYQGSVIGSQPFALEVSFDLTGTDVTDITKRRVTYQARCYAHDQSTGRRICLGDTHPGRVVGTKKSYTATLHRVTLAPGTYRLEILMELQDRPPALGYLEVPLLHAV